MAPRHVTGVALKQAGRALTLARRPFRGHHIAVEVRGILRAFHAGLERAGNAAEGERIGAEVEEALIVPRIGGVHVRHKHLGQRALVHDRAFLAGIHIAHPREHEPAAHVHAEVELPILPRDFVPVQGVRCALRLHHRHGIYRRARGADLLGGVAVGQATAHAAHVHDAQYFLVGEIHHHHKAVEGFAVAGDATALVVAGHVQNPRIALFWKIEEPVVGWTA